MGRLGIRHLQVIEHGLSASLRGNLIHAALQQLYLERPSRDQIAQWSDADLAARIGEAVRAAFRSQDRYVDPVLRQLLAMEQQRVATLLTRLVAIDIERPAFTIAEVEREFSVSLSGVKFAFRIDRIDQLDDGTVVILDYKTGTRKNFLNRDREPAQMQLVVYALAVGDEVAGLGLVNIDSRSISFDGAGRPFTEPDDWAHDLGVWQSRVETAAAEIQRGDVRINIRQGTDTARPLGLLSRIQELRHDS